MGMLESDWRSTFESRSDRYREDPANLYSKRYFRSKQGKRKKQNQAGKRLSEVLKVRSLIDFGCGLGFFLEGALQGEADWVLGIDAGYDRLIQYVPENIQRFIRKGHLGRKIDEGKWDCVLCLETAEHLLPAEEEMCIDNIVNASSRLIVFRAALSFNFRHLNPGKPKEYWVELFLKRGCKELYDEEKRLAKAWRGLLMGFIRRNVIVMKVT